MKPKEILQFIADAGAWLPIVIVRQAFEQNQELASDFLDAIHARAAARHGQNIRTHRLAAFGMFFLAQHRDRRLFEPLIRLLETSDLEQEDEWLFSGRLIFFGHRLLAGVCPSDTKQLLEFSRDPKLRPSTRSLALCAIGVLAAYGDVTRATAVASAPSEWFRVQYDSGADGQAQLGNQLRRRVCG